MGGSLVMVDRRGRWPDFTLSQAGFNFWRLAALPQGGVLALDRTTPQLGTVTGAPLQTGPADVPDPGILRSCQQNPDPPRLAATYPLPASEIFVGPDGHGPAVRLALVGGGIGREHQFVSATFSFTAGLGLAWKLDGVAMALRVAWLGDMRLAVLVTGVNEALMFDLAEAGRRADSGGRHLYSQSGQPGAVRA